MREYKQLNYIKAKNAPIKRVQKIQDILLLSITDESGRIEKGAISAIWKSSEARINQGSRTYAELAYAYHRQAIVPDIASTFSCYHHLALLVVDHTCLIYFSIVSSYNSNCY